jgi:uncharacterized protein YbjT (DUF2867 family)
VNTLTGEGLADALVGAQIVVDVTNSPSFEDAAVRAFFETSTRNLLRAEAAAGVGRHVAVSVVGADRLPASGYLRAKLVQEALIEAGPVPWTILRATQFFEFLGAIATAGMQDGDVHLPPGVLQPIAAEDVASTLADVVLGPPTSRVEVAGPERIPLDELVKRFLAATGDPRKVVRDPRASYYGVALIDDSLTPRGKARVGAIRFEDWLRQAERVKRTP